MRLNKFLTKKNLWGHPKFSCFNDFCLCEYIQKLCPKGNMTFRNWPICKFCFLFLIIVVKYRFYPTGVFFINTITINSCFPRLWQLCLVTDTDKCCEQWYGWLVEFIHQFVWILNVNNDAQLVIILLIQEKQPIKVNIFLKTLPALLNITVNSPLAPGLLCSRY